MSSILHEEFGDYSDEELIRAIVEGSGWDSEDTLELPSASDSMAELPAPIYLEFRRRFQPRLRRAAQSVGYSEEEAFSTVFQALLYGTRALVRIDGTGMFDGEFFSLAKRVCDGQKKPSNLSPSELDRLAEGAGGRTVRKRLEEMLSELDHSEQSERSPRFIDYMPEQSLSGISSPTDELREFLGDLLNQRWTRGEEIEDEVEQLTGKEREYGSLHEDLLRQARKAKRAAEAVSFASESGLFEKYDRSQEGNVGGWLSRVAKWLLGHCRDRRENKAVEQRSFQNQGQSSQQQGRGRTGPVADAPNDPSSALSDDPAVGHISRGVPEIIELAKKEYGLDPSSDLGISGELYENPIETKIELIDWLSSEHQQWFGTTHYYTVPICYRKALEEVELPALEYQLLGADLPADLDHAGDLDPPASEVRTFYMNQWHDRVCLEIQEKGGEQTPNRATIGNWVKRGRDDFKEAIKEEWPDPRADALIEVFHVGKNHGGKNGD